MRDQKPLDMDSMKDRSLNAIREKLADSLAMKFPAMTRREAVLPRIPGKAQLKFSRAV